MKKLTPMKAIRAKCIECSGGSLKEVQFCVIPECALYLFRMGKNPNRKGIGNKNISKTINKQQSKEVN